MLSLKATLKAIAESISTIKTALDGKQDKITVGTNYAIIGDLGICWGWYVQAKSSGTVTLPLHIKSGVAVTTNAWYHTYQFYVTCGVADKGTYSVLSYAATLNNTGDCFHYLAIGQLA